MQCEDRSSIVATGARQTSAFANPLRVRVLMACALEECSLSALQQRLGVSLAKLHYHVARLLAARLLIVSRTQRRAGRGIRFYRAAGDSFIVPHESLPALPGDQLSVQLRLGLRGEQSRSGELSLLYAPAQDGKVLVKLLPREPATPSRGLELWRVMRLDARQRAALAADLSDLLERHATAASGPGADAFLVHAAFAPRPIPLSRLADRSLERRRRDVRSRFGEPTRPSLRSTR